MKNQRLRAVLGLLLLIIGGCGQSGTGAFNLGSSGGGGGNQPAFHIYWSDAGSIFGKTCVNIIEPSDTAFGGVNYLCTDTDMGIVWSYGGPNNNMYCIPFNEPAEPVTNYWMDNYLCTPTDIGLRFSYAGPIPGMYCVQTMTSDPNAWGDNYVCVPYAGTSAPVSPNTLYWSSTGPIAGKTCVLVDEPSDTNWGTTNYLCSDKNIGLAWSHGGAIAGQTCVQISNPSEPVASTWADDYVCTPANIGLSWNSAGFTAGDTCVPFGHQDPDGWGNAWLCYPPSNH